MANLFTAMADWHRHKIRGMKQFGVELTPSLKQLSVIIITSMLIHLIHIHFITFLEYYKFLYERKQHTEIHRVYDLIVCREPAAVRCARALSLALIWIHLRLIFNLFNYGADCEARTVLLMTAFLEITWTCQVLFLLLLEIGWVIYRIVPDIGIIVIKPKGILFLKCVQKKKNAYSCSLKWSK